MHVQHKVIEKFNSSRTAKLSIFLLAVVCFLTANSVLAQPPQLMSVEPSAQRVHELITLRGTGFGSYQPGVSKVTFTLTVGSPFLWTADTPYVWRDDFIQVRVPAGDQIGLGDVPIITDDVLLVHVVNANGSSDTVFRVLAESTPPLAFELRANSDLGPGDLNLGRTKDAEVGDLNGDGLFDLIDNNSRILDSNTPSPSVVRYSCGDGTFRSEYLESLTPIRQKGSFDTQIPRGGNYFSLSTSYDADLVDINNDGLPDLIQTAGLNDNPITPAEPSSRMRFLLNNRPPSASCLSEGPGAPPRFVEASADWLPLTAIEGAGCPDDLAHTDVNNDGFVDFLVTLRTGGPSNCGATDDTSETRIFLNNQGTGFQLTPHIALLAPQGVSTHDGFFLDANGDGFQDVVLVNEFNVTSGQFNGSVQLFTHNGGSTPSFTQTLFQTFNNRPLFAGEAADFNHDGLIDFVVAGVDIAPPPPRNGFAVVFLNNPNAPGTFQTLELEDAGRGVFYDVELADLDLDGDVDIVAPALLGAGATGPADAVRIWRNDGTDEEDNLIFTNVTDPGSSALLPGIGDYERLSADLLDMDADGDLDLYLTGGDGQNDGALPNQLFENLSIDP